MLIDGFCHLYNLLRMMCGIITTALSVEGIMTQVTTVNSPPL